jgi:hypothetical protein
MRLIVKSVREPPFLIDVDPSMTISDIKKRLHALLGIPPELQQVILRGRPLSNSLTVSALGLSDMGTIYFYGRPTHKPSPLTPHRHCPTLRTSALSRTLLSDHILRVMSPQSLYLAQLLRGIDDDEATATFDRVQSLERWKGMDRTMNTIESRVGGARVLAAHYAVLMQLFEELEGKPAHEEVTVIAPPPERPCTAPLPMPFDKSVERIRAALKTFSTAKGRSLNFVEESKPSGSSLLELFLKVLESQDVGDDAAMESRFDFDEGEEQQVCPPLFHPKPKPRPRNRDLSDFDID